MDSGTEDGALVVAITSGVSETEDGTGEVSTGAEEVVVGSAVEVGASDEALEEYVSTEEEDWT